jgi:hypothetical protein
VPEVPSTQTPSNKDSTTTEALGARQSDNVQSTQVALIIVGVIAGLSLLITIGLVVCKVKGKHPSHIEKSAYKFTSLFDPTKS